MADGNESDDELAPSDGAETEEIMAAPAWRRAFDRWEKAVAPVLEDLTASTEFRDVLAAGARWNATVAEQVERSSRQWLHLWNLPTATDVRRLRQQVAGLQAELEAMRIAGRTNGSARALTVIEGRGGAVPTGND